MTTSITWGLPLSEKKKDHRRGKYQTKHMVEGWRLHVYMVGIEYGVYAAGVGAGVAAGTAAAAGAGSSFLTSGVGVGSSFLTSGTGSLTTGAAGVARFQLAFMRLNMVFQNS